MNRSFYALLVSQTSTNLGFALYTMAVVLHLYNETGSTTFSAAVTLVSVISHMLSGLFLPLMTDRFPLLPLLRFSQLAQLGLLLGLLLLLLHESTTIILTVIFIILFLLLLLAE